MRTERGDGPTPSGGAYAEAIIDDEGRIVEIVEYTSAGEQIMRTYARIDLREDETVWPTPHLPHLRCECGEPLPCAEHVSEKARRPTRRAHTRMTATTRP